MPEVIRQLESEIKATHAFLDALGVERVRDGKELAVYERVERYAKDVTERNQLWDECVAGHLVANCGVKPEDVTAAEKWAGHVLSK